jgi:TonB family protein
MRFSQPKRATSHLSVRPAGEGADIRELFGDQPTGGKVAVSATVVHIVAVALLLVAAQFIPEKVYKTILPEQMNLDLVYLVDPGPGGGGGGGTKSPEPVKKAEIPKVEQPKPVPIPEPVPVPVPTEPQLSLPVQTLTTVDIAAPGDLSRNAPTTGSRGSGTGTGAGPGTGSGLGPGRGGGFGGGVYNVGNGVSPPIPVFQPQPKYTADAMRAKVAGKVVVSAVVLPDGSVTDISVVRSLDQSFGLDEEAKKNAALWRFKPGTLKGQPVAVRILIELDFNLR